MARRAWRTKIALCAYCGLRAKATREHVPPRSLWPKPRAADLITVDACYDCNNKGKLDDEYLRLAPIMIADTSAGTRAGEIMRSTLEALRSDPAKRRFRDMSYSRGTLAPARSSSGLFIPKAPIFFGDRPRLDGIFKRMVRGLTEYEGLPRLPPRLGFRT